MARLVAEDRRTVTATNLSYLSDLTKLDPVEVGTPEVRAALPVKGVPEKEAWRLGLLDHLLEKRSELEREGEDVKRVVALISSLCTT